MDDRNAYLVESDVALERVMKGALHSFSSPLRHTLRCLNLEPTSHQPYKIFP